MCILQLHTGEEKATKLYRTHAHNLTLNHQIPCSWIEVPINQMLFVVSYMPLLVHLDPIQYQ